MLGGKGSLRWLLANLIMAHLACAHKHTDWSLELTTICQKCSCVMEDMMVSGDGSGAAPLQPPLDLLGG